MSKASLTPLLPREDMREMALFFVVSALCFLAALAGLSARSAYAAADSWTHEVTGQITIRVDGDEPVARRALDLVTEMPEIHTAHLISKAEAEALLRPWLGAAGVPENLPLPRLIAVESRAHDDKLGERIETALTAAGMLVTVDDHVVWTRDVKRATDTAGLAALAAVILLIATAVAVIAFATHATLLARRDMVELLHMCGAQDRFIASLFEQRFLMLGVQAGTCGAFLAFGVVAFALFVVKQSEARIWLLPQLSLSTADGLILGLTPLLAGLAAMIAARLTVNRSLSELV